MHWDRIGVYRSPIGAAFHDNTIHLNLTHGNCRNVVREAGILGNSRKDFVRPAPLNESDAENMQNLPLFASIPFVFATTSSSLVSCRGPWVWLRRFHATTTPPATTKSPWIICRYTLREHRRYKLRKQGKSTRDCASYTSRIITGPLQPLALPLRTADASRIYARQNFR